MHLRSIFSSLLLCLPLHTQAGHSHKDVSFKNCRFDEDWTAVLDCSACDNLMGRIKNMKVSDDLNLSLGGQARVRLETWDGFGFGPANDDTFVLGRFRLHGDLHYQERARLFVEAKSAISSPRDLPGGKRTLDVDEIALQNAFVDFQGACEWFDQWTVRLGRQELSFGKQRFVSPLDWANTRRTFDGGRLMLHKGKWHLNAFYTHPVRVRKYTFNSSSGRDYFTGMYLSGKAADPVNLDVYWMLRDRDTSSYNGLTASESRHSIGARIWGKTDGMPLDFDVEGTYQFGDFGAQSISAYQFAALVGYSLEDVYSKPHLFAGIDIASGDEVAGAGDLGTFSHLFPLGHAYLGFIDVVGRQNILAYHVGAKAKPAKGLLLLAQAHFFHRMESGDGLYNAGAGLVRAAAAGSKEVGQEIDLLAKYKVNKHFVVLAGYSHFFAGDYIDTVSPAANEDTDFFYLSGQYTF